MTAVPDWLGAFSNLNRYSQSYILQSIISRIERGTIEVVLPDGKYFRATGGQTGPSGRIVVRNAKFFQRLLRESDLGFGEMFMQGWWTTPDLQALLDVIMLNNRNIVQRLPGARLFRYFSRLRHLLNANNRKGSKRNIAFHYDLGNAFYDLWLDETMTYSSALFHNERETLIDAQRNKYAAICDRLAPASNDHILEIGCGWGGFAEYLARERGARVTGLTISRQQYDYARRRIFKAGLAERVEILLRDYRDERGAYDKIASIEMIECGRVRNTGRPTSRRSTTDCDRAVSRFLQAITIADWLYPQYRTGMDFIRKYIFPGGMLPTGRILRDQSVASGLETIGSETFADSYSRTLRAWRERFNNNWEQIAQFGFDDCFYRMWNLYLAAGAAGFASGATDVIQVAYRRTGLRE